MSGDKAGRAGRRWTRGDQAWVRDHSERNGRSRKGRRKYGACPPGRVSVPKARAASRPTSAQMNQNRSRARDHQRYQGLDEVVGDWHACTQTQATPNRQSGRFEVPARLAGDEVSIEGPYGEGRQLTVKAGRYRLAGLLATNDRPPSSGTDASRRGVSWGHDEEPYWIGTSITWLLAQVLDVGPRDQTVATVAPATRATAGAPAPKATVVVPRGGVGNSRHPLVEPPATNNRSAPDASLSRTKRPLPSAAPKDATCS